MARKRSNFSKDTLRLVAAILQVLEDLQSYWPLTLRQVYYQLVAKEIIENNKNQYMKLSNVLTRARLQSLCPWGAIEDRSRAHLGSDGWESAGEFVNQQTEDYLKGYRRDLLQSQDINLELWVEKDALSRVCHRAAFPYCVSVIVAKGYSSISFVHECAKRIQHYHSAYNRNTVLLYFGDLDPSGWNMLPAMMETLEYEMDLFGLVEPKRCALNLDQVNALNLPHNPDALKFTDPRAKEYVAQFGEMAVELDAISPPELEQIIRDSIESVLDMDKFDEEKRIEEEERNNIGDLKDEIDDFVTDKIDDWQAQ